MSRKKKKKTAVKHKKSFVLRLLFIFFAFIMVLAKGLGRLLFWFFVMITRNSRKNPLAAVGLFGFLLALVFVGMNAVFQPSSLIRAERIVLPVKKPILPSPEKDRVSQDKIDVLQERDDELAKIIRQMEE